MVKKKYFKRLIFSFFTTFILTVLLVAYFFNSEKNKKDLIKENNKDIFIETDYRYYTHKHAVLTADGWKFIFTIESGKRELYNLANDPNEKNNLVGENPKLALDLEKRIKKHLEDLGRNPYQP